MLKNRNKCSPRNAYTENFMDKRTDVCRNIFVEHACGERDILVTMTLWYMSLCASVHPSEFVRTITSAIVVGFQSNLTHLFSIMCRCAISNIHLGSSKVKVTGARHVVFRQPSSLKKVYLQSSYIVVNLNPFPHD